MAVADLGTAAGQLERRYGLASVEGGRHPAWGTANRIVPLGETYLELVTVVDETAAAESAFGRWVGAMRSPSGRLIGWAARTKDLDTLARRLDLRISSGSRRDPAGAELRWRGAGIEAAVAEPARPFFIEWDPATPYPGRLPVTHPVGEVELARLELTADPVRLAAWLGEGWLPIVVRPGDPAVTRVILRARDREIVLGAAADAG
jgi:hypothetical protein